MGAYWEVGRITSLDSLLMQLEGATPAEASHFIHVEAIPAGFDARSISDKNMSDVQEERH